MVRQIQAQVEGPGTLHRAGRVIRDHGVTNHPGREWSRACEGICGSRDRLNAAIPFLYLTD